MSEQLRLRFKPKPSKGDGLPALDPDERANLRALPAEIVRGIASLCRQRPPQITKPNIWPVIVSDALTLATTGWASDALALGWHPLELFGCAAAVDGDDARLGLAGRLAGRDVVRIAASAALLRDGPASVILRRNRAFEDTIFLWSYGQ